HRFGMGSPPGPEPVGGCRSVMVEDMARRLRKVATAVVVGVIAIWAMNTSLFHAPGAGPTPPAPPRNHPTLARDGLTAETCTAGRMDPPTHQFLENTLPSMEAAFAAGADMIEFDIHPTTDGQFAVLHDWTLDCRTDGKGVTREHSMAALKALDIG